MTLENSTLAVTNHVDAADNVMKFKNVTIADGASRFTATGDYEPETGGSWNFVVPSTGYDAAPIQANNITIPTGHKLAIDLSAVTTAGTNVLATAATALTIADTLSVLESHTAYTQTGLKANLVLLDAGKTLAVEVKRNLAVCGATVKSPETIEYTGSDLTSKIKFDVTGTFGGAAVTLIEGTDYDITLTNAVGREESSTTYVATITGKGGCVGTIEAEYTILGRVFVWVGGDSTENQWNDATKWDRVGSGTNHGWPGDGNDKFDIPKFLEGEAYVNLPQMTESGNIVYVKYFDFDPASRVTAVQNGIDAVYSATNSTIRGAVHEILDYTGDGARGHALSFGGDKAYLYYPVLEGSLAMDKNFNCPWGTAIWFGGSDSPTLSATSCTFGQGTWGYEFISFYCENDNLPVKIAMTNTIWRATCGSKDANMVGRNATWTYCNSTNLTGIIANHFGGSLTLDNSVVGFQNLHGTVAAQNGHLPGGATAEGDTFNATGLAFSGANTKFALSEHATVKGDILFTMPAAGFANNAGVINYHNGGNVDFNIDTTFAGVAPFAVATNLNLSAATLSVDATAVGSTAGVYPLVRVGEAGTLTLPTEAMTVTGVAAGYIGWVKTTADGKGLDLVVEVASVDNVIWTAENNYTNFWYTGETGVHPTVIGTTPQGYVLVPDFDYTVEFCGTNSTKSISEPLGVGDYRCKVIGVSGRFSGTDYVVPFRVVRQSYTWTSSSGSDGVGTWEDGAWVTNTLVDVGNGEARLIYPTGVAEVYLRPDSNTVASIDLGGTASEPRVAYGLHALGYHDTAVKTTTWLHDGYLKLLTTSGAGGTSVDTAKGATLAFSNVTLLANSTLNMRLYHPNFSLVFAGTNALVGIQPYFEAGNTGKTLRFENGATTIDDQIRFGTTSGNSMIVDNASVSVKNFDSSSNSSQTFAFKFKLGDLNLSNSSVTDFTPLLLVTNSFNLHASIYSDTFSRTATVDAKSKMIRGESFDILTVPLSFDPCEQLTNTKGVVYAPFAPATLAANTTCAAGLVPQITVVTNETTAMQTVRLRILEQLASVELETASVPYTGTNVVPVVKKVTTGTGAELTDSTIGWTVTYWRGDKENDDWHTPGTVTVKVTGTGDLSGEVTTSFVIRGHYEVVDAEAGVTVQVSQTWADEAYGNGGTGPAVQTKLETANAYGIKGWEAYALGFAAGQAANAAAVVQPVQTATPDQLTLKLGDWPTTKPSDSGVTVKYQLHNAQTVGAAFTAIKTSTEGPQFDIPLSDWTSNVQYYRIRPVFENN